MKPDDALGQQGVAETGRLHDMHDLGDRVACGLLLAALIVTVVLGAWFITDMPSLR